MCLLDRYLFRQVFMTSLGAVGVFAFVLLAGNVVKDLLSAAMAGRVDVQTFLELLALLIPYVVAYALPMGVLTAVLLVLGRLSSQQEITAMRAAGWGIRRIAAPVIVFAVLGGLACLIFSAEIAPRARTIYRERLGESVKQNPLSFIAPQVFVRDFPGYVIYVAEKKGGLVRDLWLWELDKENRVVRLVRAEEGTLQFDAEESALKLLLRNGHTEIRSGKDPETLKTAQTTLSFSDGSLALPLEKLFGKNTARRKLSLMSYSELQAELDAVDANKTLPEKEAFGRRISISYAIQQKFVTAFAVVAFTIVGVPLGIKMQRQESSANLGLALVLSMGFYLLLIIVDWLQKRPELRPDLLLWTPNLIFLALGFWLFRKAEQR